METCNDWLRAFDVVLLISENSISALSSWMLVLPFHLFHYGVARLLSRV